MRILMVSSSREACGVRSYSDFLTEALLDLAIPDLDVDGTESDAACKETDIVAFDPTHIHLQFQETLYPAPHLFEWLDLADARGIPVVVTFHDRCIPQIFPFQLIHHAIAHTSGIRERVVKPDEDVTLLPLGIPLVPFQVISFGLGRTCKDVVQDAVDQVPGAAYTYLDGSQDFLPYEELMLAIRSSDVVVLWYPESHGTGSSFAARLAIGCRRTLITNQVSWFQGLPGGSDVVQVDGLEELARRLIGMATEQEAPIQDQTMEAVAQAHVRIYHNLRGSSSGG